MLPDPTLVDTKLAPDVVIRLEPVPSTQPGFPSVPDARMDSGVRSLRRHLVSRLRRPEAPLPQAHVEISVPPLEPSCLRCVSKSVVDALAEYEVISNDRAGISVNAHLDGTDGTTRLRVTDPTSCWDCPRDHCNKQTRYPHGCLRFSATSSTNVLPVGTMPLVSPSHEAVTRDAEYVRLLAETWTRSARFVAGDPGALANLTTRGRLRVSIAVHSPDTADLDNVTWRVLDMLHVGMHLSAGCPVDETWGAAPAIDDLMVELEYDRSNLQPRGVTVAITVLDGYEYVPAVEVDDRWWWLTARKHPL